MAIKTCEDTANQASRPLEMKWQKYFRNLLEKIFPSIFEFLCSLLAKQTMPRETLTIHHFGTQLTSFLFAVTIEILFSTITSKKKGKNTEPTVATVSKRPLLL